MYYQNLEVLIRWNLKTTEFEPKTVKNQVKKRKKKHCFIPIHEYPSIFETFLRSFPFHLKQYKFQIFGLPEFQDILGKF